MSWVAGRRFDVAEAVLGRDGEGRLVVEGQRPKSDVWRLEIDPDLAASPLGRVAAHHFAQDGEESVGDGNHVVWTVHHRWAEDLVEVLAHSNHEGLLSLIRKSINQKES